MRATARTRQIRRLTALAAVSLIAVLGFSAASGTGHTIPAKRVVKVESLSDGGSVLANLRGRTLYTLSAERQGKFICTAGCLSIWRPLVVAKGVKPTGPVALRTVERPNGKVQVTYRGRPLYSFAEDTRAGEATGEGITDVGTWHAAKPPASLSPQPTEPEPIPPTPYPTSPYPPTPPPSESPPTNPPTDPPYDPPYGY